MSKNRITSVKATNTAKHSIAFPALSMLFPLCSSSEEKGKDLFRSNGGVTCDQQDRYGYNLNPRFLSEVKEIRNAMQHSCLLRQPADLRAITRISPSCNGLLKQFSNNRIISYKIIYVKENIKSFRPVGESYDMASFISLSL